MVAEHGAAPGVTGHRAGGTGAHTEDPPVAAGATARDTRVVAGQLGRAPRPISGVAARCPHGFPAVVEMPPVDERGRPFPTLYYLTCPTAVAAVGAVENGGGVGRFQRALKADERLRASLAAAVHDTRTRRAELAAAVRETQARRPRLAARTRPADSSSDPGAGALAAALATGVGGVADPTRLKCLHAHAAHALARPGYALGEAVVAEAGALWCDDRRCAAFGGETA